MEGSKTPEQIIAHKRSFDEQQEEDSATMKASEDLKHTRISDREPTDGDVSQTEAETANAVLDKDKHAPLFMKETTPERSARSVDQDEEMREQISSPKKKRVRELDDEAKEGEETNKAKKDRVPSNGSATSVDRTDRSEPEKKRHRDLSEGEVEGTGEAPPQQSASSTDGNQKTKTADNEANDAETKADRRSQKATTGTSADLPQTSSSAFASSGFGALAASSTSGFGALAGKTSVFGDGSTTAASPFGTMAASKSSTDKPKGEADGFGNTNGITVGGAGSQFGSAFGSASTGGFGSGFGSAFGGGFGGGFATGPSKTLSTFGSTNQDTAKLGKPAKAFGAPESDAEDESGDDEDAEGDVGSDHEDDIATSHEDKKKLKLTKVPVHDGEEDEITLSQFRAKLFAMESKEQGWQERGVGNLKVNVNKSCVEYDEYTGAPIPGSFDVSLRDEPEDAAPVIAARMVMRQENTHRVILNTSINRALKLEDKPSNAAGKGYMFTAFDGAKPVNMLLKMNENNAKLFISEISSIQNGLL